MPGRLPSQKSELKAERGEQKDRKKYDHRQKNRKCIEKGYIKNYHHFLSFSIRLLSFFYPFLTICYPFPILFQSLIGFQLGVKTAAKLPNPTSASLTVAFEHTLHNNFNLPLRSKSCLPGKSSPPSSRSCRHCLAN